MYACSICWVKLADRVGGEPSDKDKNPFVFVFVFLAHSCDAPYCLCRRGYYFPQGWWLTMINECMNECTPTYSPNSTSQERMAVHIIHIGAGRLACRWGTSQVSQSPTLWSRGYIWIPVCIHSKGRCDACGASVEMLSSSGVLVYLAVENPFSANLSHRLLDSMRTYHWSVSMYVLSWFRNTLHCTTHKHRTR
jgi:hypothetical protein